MVVQPKDKVKYLGNVAKKPVLEVGRQATLQPQHHTVVFSGKRKHAGGRGYKFLHQHPQAGVFVRRTPPHKGTAVKELECPVGQVKYQAAPPYGQVAMPLHAKLNKV